MAKVLEPDDEALIIHLNKREHVYSITEEGGNFITIRIDPIESDSKPEEEA